jgi:isopenicillin N synthase-like dioxygenase
MRISQLPVIDVSKPARLEARQAIDVACRDWGIFFIVGHGIARSVIASLQEQMHSFFAQPLASKREIVRTAENPWGFYDHELTKHTPDWKQVYDFGPGDGPIQPQ